MELTEENLEAILAEGQAALEEIKELAQAKMPLNLGDAVEKGIDVSILVAEAAVLIHYSHDDRRIDRQRVVRLDVALQIMQEMEEEYLRLTVEGALRVLWGFFTFTPALIYNALVGIYQAIKKVEYELAKQAILRLWRDVLRNLLSCVAASEIIGPLRVALELRGRVDARMRRAALKQRTNVKRVWRRKRTRG